MRGREFAFPFYHSIPDNLKIFQVFDVLVKVAASSLLGPPTQRLTSLCSAHTDPSTSILKDILSLFISAGYS